MAFHRHLFNYTGHMYCIENNNDTSDQKVWLSAYLSFFQSHILSPAMPLIVTSYIIIMQFLPTLSLDVMQVSTNSIAPNSELTSPCTS